jgi:plasmid stabilization system protein ParE
VTRWAVRGSHDKRPYDKFGVAIAYHMRRGARVRSMPTFVVSTARAGPFAPTFTRKARPTSITRLFINQETPEVAFRLVARLFMAAHRNPKDSARPTTPGVHALIVARLNYLIFFRLAKAEIQVLHIRHTSRSRWRR